MGVRDREKLRQQESAVMYNNKRILVDDDEVREKAAELQKQKASQSAASVQKSVPSLNIQRRTPENTIKPLTEKLDYTYYKMTGNVLPQTKTAAELQDEVNSFVRNSNNNAIVAQKYYSDPSKYNSNAMASMQSFYDNKAYSDFRYKQLKANLLKNSKENGTTWTQRALKAIEESQKLQNGIDEYIRLGERAYYAEQYNKNQKKGLTQEEIDAGAKELAENPITLIERGMHFAHKGLKDSWSLIGNLVGKDDPNSISKRVSEMLNNAQPDASRRIELENAVHADVMRYRLDQFENVKNNADFAEKSKGIDESKYKIQRMFDDDGLIPVVDKFGKNVEKTLQDDYISEEEQQIYNYIYNTKGYKEAEEYYDLLTLKLNERMTTDYLGQVEEMTLDAPVPLNVASFATNAMSGIGYVNDTVNTLSGKPLDTNNLYHLPANVTNEIRTTTQDNYIDSDVGKFLYSTGMSMGDFAISAAFGKIVGVPQIATVLLSTSVATNTVIDAKNRGLSDAQAYTLGTTAGAIEYVTEKIPLDNLFDAVVNKKATAQMITKQIVTEGTEELVSSSINLITDVIVSKDKSEWEVLIAEYMKQGMSREKAIEEAVKHETGKLALDFAGGAISGAVMGGGVSAYNNTVNNRYNKIVGNQLLENNQNQNVFELAKGLDYNSKANEYAYSANPKKSNQLGKLYDKAYFQADTEVNNNSNQIIAQRLADLGEKASTIPEISEGIRKTVYNEPLSEHERNMLGASKNARQVLKEFEDALSGRESAIRHESIDRRNKLSAALTTKSIDNTVTVGSKKDKTKITGVKSISENGVVTYNLENGKTATSKEVSFDNEFTAQLNESASKYGAVGADAFIKMYGGEDAVEYSQAFDALFRQGKNDPDGKLKADVMNTPAAQFLNPSQSEAAYEAGRVYAQKLSAKPQQEINSKPSYVTDVENIAQKGSQKTIGNVNITGIRTKNLTKKQKASINVMNEVSKVTGGTLKMVAFESTADLDGQIRESNGWYDAETNTIYFDINAGIDNVYRQGELDRAILRTGSHELTHFVQNMSPEYYAGLKGFIVDSLNSADPNGAETLVAAKMNSLNLTYDEALDEVIADSCEMLLRDSKAIQKLARENMTLAQKIKAWIDDFVRNIKKAFEGVSAKSQEAVILEQILGDMTELQNMWDEALEDALRKSKEKGTANGTQGEVDVDNSDSVVYSKRQQTKKKSSVYKEYDSLAMKWANEADRAEGDTKIFCKNGRDFRLLEADGNGGFVELARGNYKKVSAIYERSIRETDSSIRRDIEAYGLDKRRHNGDRSIRGGQPGYDGRNNSTTSGERLQSNSSGNNEHNRTSDKGKSVKFSDRAYLDAVESGDMETAQNMVDEAAQKAGYTVRAMHATNADFTVFDVDKTSRLNYHGQGIYFTNSTKDIESNYENHEGPDPWEKIEGEAYELLEEKYGYTYDDTLTGDSEIIGLLNECYDEAIDKFYKTIRRVKAFLKFDNPLIVDQYSTVTDEDIRGHDGIIDKFVYQNIGHSGMDENTVHYIVLNPNNIKSAEAVTYDDNGNVIPLSERFKSDNPDIRYSKRGSDSDGNKLSENQIEYFKDSKVRDESGNLLVMYHGTPHDFTVFKNRGSGMYFTADPEYAYGYTQLSGKVMKVYLNITKPFDILKDNVAKKIFVDEFIKGGYAQGIHPSSNISEINKYIENGVDWVEGDNLIEFLEENDYDYDGLVINEGSDSVSDGTGNKAVWRGFSYVTFNSNQAKNVDNVNPTVNPDIRYSHRSSDVGLEKNAIKNWNDESVKFSLRSSVEETKGLVAVHNMTVDELQKSLQLGGLPMPSIAIIKAKRGHSEYGDVSLVFDKNVIDPKVDKNNKVYGGDAWTPVYPKIEYKVNDKVAKRISDTYYEVYEKYGSDEARPLYNYTYDLENQLNSSGGEVGLINKLKDDESLMQLYLLQNGNQKIEPITKEIVTELSADEVEMYNYLIALLGENIVSEFITPEGEKPLDYRKEYFSKYGEQIENAYKQLLKDNYHFSQDEINNVVDNMRKYDFVNLMKRTYTYHKHGKKTVKTETDYTATSRAIREAVKNSNYNQWIDSLFNGVEEKSGIRNNADYFTSSGNRRSWEALHWVNNLENVVKVMKAQNNGVAAFFSGHGIWAVSTKNYRSIDEIKADSDRLKNMPQEQYNSIKEDFGMRFNEIAMSVMDKSERNQFIAIDNAMQCIIDAVRRSKTKSGILRELKQYRQLDVTETAVDDIITLVSDIANMPTEYFEAKPQRAVKLEEVATAIVPDNISDALKKELIKYKIDFVEYETGNEESRLSALNSLTDIQFSHRSTQFENEGEEDTSNFTHRELLRNALSTVAQNDTERDFLARYQREIKDVEKKYEEVAKLRRQIHDISFTKGSDRSQLPAIKNRVAILEDQIQRTDKKLLQLEATKALKDVVEREKKTAVKKANERNKQTFERYKSRKRSSEVREKIKSLHKDLVKSLLYPTDKNYIPPYLVKSMVDVCNAIDFSTDRTGPDGGKTKAQEQREKIKASLNKLKNEYEKLKKDSDPNYRSEYDEAMAEELTQLIDMVSNSRVGDMTETQLQAVYQSLKTIQGTLRDAKKQIGMEEGRSNAEIGLGIIEEQRQIDRKKKGVKKLGQKYSDLIAWNTVSPMRNILRISGYDRNSELYQLAEQLNEGQRKKDIFVMESHKMFEHLIEGKENKKKYQDAIGKAHDFGIVDVDGNAVEMSKMTAMQLVMSWEREMASDGKHSHLQQSGAIIPNHKLLMDGKVSEAVSAEHAQRIDVDATLINDIFEQLDEWDKEYMEVAHKFFDEKSKNALNETSRVVSHRDVALSEKYIPYKVDEDFVFKKEISDENHIRPTLISMGMLKDTVRNAGQPLVMTSLNHVLDTQIEQVGAYYGLAIPVRNFNKVWNFMSDNRISVRESITKNWGKKGMMVIDQTIRDLQAERVSERNKFIDKANSAFVRSVLNSNISVTLKQLSALPSAYSVLNQRFMPGYVYGQFLKMCVPSKYNQTIKEIDEYTAAHWLRRQGLSSQELGDIAKSMGRMKRFNDWLPAAINPTKWIQGMDCLVTASFWDMCKKDIRKQGEFEDGTEEFNRAVADLYNRVIEDTQAVYDTLHRPEVLKTTNALTRQLFMFRSESLQHSGILYEKYGAFLENKDAESRKEFFKTAYAQFSSAFSFAALSLVAAGLLHKMNPYRDEDEELTPESIIAELLNDLTNVLADLVMPIGGAQLQEFIYGKISGNKYSDGSLSVPAVDFINDFIDSVSTLNDAITAEEPDDGKIIKAVEDLTFKFAGLFGVPADNVKNIIKTFILSAEDIKNGEFGSFEAGVDRSNTVNYHRATEALTEGDMQKYNDVIAELNENEVGQDKIQQGIRNQLKDFYLEGRITDKQAIEFLAKYGGDDDENDAYFTVKSWNAKVENADEEGYSWSVYNDLEDAVVSGGNIDSAVNELINHGYEEDKVYGKIKSITKSAYLSGEMTQNEAGSLIAKYLDKDDSEIYWIFDEWDYYKENPSAESGSYQKYGALYEKIDEGGSADIAGEVKRYMDNGVSKKNIGSTLTKQYKDKYIELYYTDKTAAANLKNSLLRAYYAAGYNWDNKSKDIDAWLKDS